LAKTLKIFFIDFIQPETAGLFKHYFKLFLPYYNITVNYFQVLKSYSPYAKFFTSPANKKSLPSLSRELKENFSGSQPDCKGIRGEYNKISLLNNCKAASIPILNFASLPRQMNF
jgi:hypothetical protein